MAKPQKKEMVERTISFENDGRAKIVYHSKTPSVSFDNVALAHIAATSATEPCHVVNERGYIEGYYPRS